jgi:dTDP-4-amino-4,6-dideoxygalactose transaminase
LPLLNPVLTPGRKFFVAEFVSGTTLSLPLSPGMTDNAMDRVIEACHDVLR